MSDIVERLGNLNDALLACGSDYSDILLGAVNEFKQLRQQLAEYQVREKSLREWFKTLLYNSPKNSYPSIVAEEALAMPHDSTDLDALLKQAKREALLEAADIVDINNMPLKSRELRRMAEELK